MAAGAFLVTDRPVSHRSASGSAIVTLHEGEFLGIRLPQSRVLGFGMPVDRNVGISIFPERKEILIRLAHGGLVAHHGLRPGKLQVGDRSKGPFVRPARMFEDLLELRNSLRWLAQFKIRVATDIGWQHAAKLFVMTGRL